MTRPRERRPRDKCIMDEPARTRPLTLRGPSFVVAPSSIRLRLSVLFCVR